MKELRHALYVDGYKLEERKYFIEIEKEKLNN